MIKHITIFAVSLVILSNAILGCATVKSHLDLTNRSSSEVPDDAFAFVAVKHTISPSECLPGPLYEKCLEILEELPPIVKTGSGSGLLVWSPKRPVFLTAAHVCTDDTPEVYSQGGLSFSLKKDLDIRVLGATGVFMKTSIVKIDEETDLCALDVPKMTAAPVKLAHKGPKVGDIVYAISAPFGIHKPTMTLVFSGHYSGYGEKWNYYTMTTRPGSSGSVVLDKNFRAVGMLNAAFVHIEGIGLGAGYDEIVEFVKTIE
tara:strand:- start:1210 stop:1986 length:777 start_codon:yes stop_codon:yes gene_type:complete